MYHDLSSNNESLVLDKIHERFKIIEAHCKKVSGRKLQKNATPVREAVVNLNSHHTMEDLKTLAKRLKEEKQIDCFQIHLHRDEGKSRDELNFHAHLVFDWQNKEKGTMLKLNRADMSQIQTIVAETLGMERGELKENSNRERLEAIEYKRAQEEKKVKTIEEKIERFDKRADDLIEYKRKWLFFKTSDSKSTRENVSLFAEKCVQEAQGIVRSVEMELRRLKLLKPQVDKLEKDKKKAIEIMERQRKRIEMQKELLMKGSPEEILKYRKAVQEAEQKQSKKEDKMRTKRGKSGGMKL